MRGPGRIARGLLTDPDRPVAFRFDGRRMQGLEGDTLASALLANGRRLVARSFKYHRPRGIVTAGPEEPSALVDVIDAGGREPNRLATTLALHEGLVAESQNRWPSLRFDVLALNDEWEAGLQALSLKESIDMFETAHYQLFGLLSALPPEQWSGYVRAWLPGATWHHFEEHGEQIRAWRQSL